MKKIAKLQFVIIIWMERRMSLKIRAMSKDLLHIGRNGITIIVKLG